MKSDKTPSRHTREIDLPDDFAACVARARREVETEFRQRTAQAGTVRHYMNPPLEVEEALDPALDWPWAEPIHPH